jgi:Mlc titration factor MtfA (ptsG expression regulator)
MPSWLPWVRRKRERLRATPLPPEWREIALRNVRSFSRLDEAERAKLEGLVQLFLTEKTFEGCGGLEMTDEIRVTVAVQACLLLLGLEVDEPYPDLDVIRVYPRAMRIPRTEREGWVISEGHVPHAGLSSRHGYVVLSWDAARQGAFDDKDGQNVVLHEFAHQLDTEDGAADGAPVLADPNQYRPWAKVLGAAYEQLLQDVDAERRNVLDAYGATHPAEFFAVATEAFFERPARLKAEQPRLYEVLARYYGQDPADR